MTSDNYQRVYGLHSNIPPCCVEEWIKNLHKSDRVRRNKFKRVQEEKERTGLDWDYIPCNKCLKEGKVNKIHVCTRGCIAELTPRIDAREGKLLFLALSKRR